MLESLTAAITAVTTVGSSLLTWVTGNDVLAIFLGISVVGGVIGCIARVRNSI